MLDMTIYLRVENGEVFLGVLERRHLHNSVYLDHPVELYELVSLD